MTSTKVKDLAFGKKDGEILCLKLGLVVCGLSSHSDLHKNKGHKSVSVRENMSKPPPPSVMVAFGKTVIFHHNEPG